MAENTIDIAGASQDFQTIEDFVNLPADSEVYPRLLPSVNVGTLAGAREAIFEAGGLPATPFATKALMTASALVDGDYAQVTDDAANNGLYVKTAGAWVKSAYDPALSGLTLAKTASDTSMTTIFSPDINKYIYVEQATTTAYNLYVKLGRFYIIKGQVLNGSFYTWANIKTDVADPSLFVTTPKGELDCLMLNNQALVFILATSKFAVIARNLAKPSEHIILASSAFGQLTDGKMLETWLNYRDSKGASAVESYQFYMGAGDKQPVIEQSKPSQSGELYFKLDSIRLRSSGGLITRSTWQSIVDDIANPALFETSYNGVANSLKLNDKALVYDLTTKKFKVNISTNYDANNEILIARGAYGQLTDGVIFEWWINKRVTANMGGSTGGGGGFGVKSPQPKYIAHGGLNGNARLAPFNTGPAYRLAGEYGMWGAETDLVETKDGEWICCHDLVVDNYSYSTGNVKDFTLAELKEMDATKKSESHGWSDVPFLELNEFLEICVQYDLVPVMEIKSVPVAAGVDKIVSTIRKHMPISNSVLMTFTVATLELIRERHYDAPLWLLTSNLTTADIDTALALGNCQLSVGTSSTPAKILEASKAGLEVGMWTLSQDEINSSKSQGLSYVTSDSAVPYTFEKGLIAENFRSDATFSNLTSLGVATVADKVLTVPSGISYLNIPAKQGDVIIVSCEARNTIESPTEKPFLKIDAFNTTSQRIATYTAKSIASSTFSVYTMSAIVTDDAAALVRISLNSSANSGIEIRDLRVRRIEV